MVRSPFVQRRTPLPWRGRRRGRSMIQMTPMAARQGIGGDDGNRPLRPSTRRLRVARSLWRSGTARGRVGSYGIHTNALPHRLRRRGRALEGMTGIEPALSAWEAEVLPLNYIPGGPFRRPASITGSGWRAPFKRAVPPDRQTVGMKTRIVDGPRWAQSWYATSGTSTAAVGRGIRPLAIGPFGSGRRATPPTAPTPARRARPERRSSRARRP